MSLTPTAYLSGVTLYHSQVMSGSGGFERGTSVQLTQRITESAFCPGCKPILLKSMNIPIGFSGVKSGPIYNKFRTIQTGCDVSLRRIRTFKKQGLVFGGIVN